MAFHSVLSMNSMVLGLLNVNYSIWLNALGKQGEERRKRGRESAQESGVCEREVGDEQRSQDAVFYIYIYIYTHMHTCTHTYTHTCISAYTYDRGWIQA